MFRIVLRMLKVNGDDVPGRGILPLVQQALVAGPSACSAPSALLSAPPDCHCDDVFCHQHQHHLYHLQDIWSYVAVRIPLCLLLSTRRWGREKVTSKRCLTHLLISTITTTMVGITIIITIIIFLTWLLGSSS